MIVQMTTTVALDPMKEFEVVEQYRKDKGWEVLSDCTVAVVFGCKTPQYNMSATYMPSNERGAR